MTLKCQGCDAEKHLSDEETVSLTKELTEGAALKEGVSTDDITIVDIAYFCGSCMDKAQQLTHMRIVATSN